MYTRIRQKWRPPLALVVACTLVAVLSLPLIGLGLLRWWAPILGWVPSDSSCGILATIPAGEQERRADPRASAEGAMPRKRKPSHGKQEG